MRDQGQKGWAGFLLLLPDSNLDRLWPMSTVVASAQQLQGFNSLADVALAPEAPTILVASSDLLVSDIRGIRFRRPYWTMHARAARLAV